MVYSLTIWTVLAIVLTRDNFRLTHSLGTAGRASTSVNTRKRRPSWDGCDLHRSLWCSSSSKSRSPRRATTSPAFSGLSSPSSSSAITARPKGPENILINGRNLTYHDQCKKLTNYDKCKKRTYDQWKDQRISGLIKGSKHIMIHGNAKVYQDQFNDLSISGSIEGPKHIRIIEGPKHSRIKWMT